jgi:hypothetical protein
VPRAEMRQLVNLEPKPAKTNLARPAFERRGGHQTRCHSAVSPSDHSDFLKDERKIIGHLSHH